MRALVQRVSEGSVVIDGTVCGRIGRGCVIFVGVKKGDTHADARFLADKCAALRVMEDSAGKMNLSLKDVGGSALVISQFTLYGDAQRGNRPGFTHAAPPALAEPLYDLFVQHLRETLGEKQVHTGVFGAMMSVMINNNGPVTIMIDSPTLPQ